MATTTNDDNKTHWVEDDSTLKAEPSFVKKKPNNVSLFILLFFTVLL